MDNKAKDTTIFHKSFELAILLKAINGALEVLGGIVLIVFNPAKMNGLIAFITKSELLEDPDDFIANRIIKLGEAFSVSTQHFLIAYLLVHGIIKLLLVALLWQKKIWAYPLTIAALVLFILYQIERYFYQPSLLLVFLTLFDGVIIWLTLIEYKSLRQKR